MTPWRRSGSCWRRSEYCAFCHWRPVCRGVNVTKATLEWLLADELALLQPTPGSMRLFTESVLQTWKARKAAVRDEFAAAERATQAIQEKLERPDEPFCRAHWSSGRRRCSNNACSSKKCSFRAESRSTETAVVEPP